jgi:hypothetical protein
MAAARPVPLMIGTGRFPEIWQPLGYAIVNLNLVVGLFEGTYLFLSLPVSDRATSINHRQTNASR